MQKTKNHNPILPFIFVLNFFLKRWFSLSCFGVQVVLDYKFCLLRQYAFGEHSSLTAISYTTCMKLILWLVHPQLHFILIICNNSLLKNKSKIDFVFLVLTIFNEFIGHLSQSSIEPSIYFSLNVKPCSWNQQVLSNGGKVTCSRSWNEPMTGFKSTTDSLRVRHTFEVKSFSPFAHQP